MSAFRDPWIPRFIAAAFLAAVVVGAFASGADRILGREVILIAPHDASSVALQRALWVPGDPVAEIYGNPLGAPVRVVRPDPERVIRPAEDPSLMLLPAGSSEGSRPLQVKTVWFVARPLILLFLAIAALGTALRLASTHMHRKESTT